jgi:S1-C subfamily serine protease
VITSIAGRTVHSVAALQEAVDAKKPGDTITVVFTRNGSSHTIQVKLTTRPA